ncbi:chorismate pyruvate-lyase family protein [Geoglobus acetivorans]|uniref:Chorismate lyase n=1 Tax=Geoglobus acetivorans TaxID=565033 RepID=A0A0A7GC74_GEOAI|nr:hypothetical protein GACE_0371 [Geoglobus acetivorans]
MNPILRILERTDGSVTSIIEALTGERAEIKTIEQKVIGAGPEIAQMLNISEGDEVNFRVVDILSAGIRFARAVSYTPLKRLDESFKRDLMSADIPVGKIISKYKLEVRREINWSCIKENDLGKCLVRNYSIIHRREVLINITESFPFSAFDSLRWE